MNRMLKAKKKMLCAVMVLVVVLAAITSVSAYAAGNPLMLTVRQNFDTSSAAAGAAFTYRLRPLDAGSPMPAGSPTEGYAFVITGTANAELGPLTYSQPGVYRYELKQIPAEKPGYTYDTRIYTITAHVDTALRIELVVMLPDNTKAQAIEFRNTYGVLPSDPNLMFDPPVKKTVAGNPAKASAFTFRLTAGNPSNPMPAGSVNGVKTIQITGAGEGKFGTWSYNKAGTYYYTVMEAGTGEVGYTFDSAVYTITDMVTEKDGRLALSRVVTNDLNKPVTALDFINKYSAGKDGPKTGDGIHRTLYILLFAAGGAVAVFAVVYLIASRKRKAK